MKLLLIGAASSGLPVLLGYYFFSRRLCGVFRRYSFAPLSSSGAAFDIAVFNRGYRNEADIAISLDPNRQYELLAASSGDIALSGRKLTIRRLPAGSDASAVVQVDGGDFSGAQILEFSSEHAKGKLYDSLELVPAKPGAAMLGLLVVFGSFFALLYGAFYMGRTMDSDEVPALLRTETDTQKIEADKKTREIEKVAAGLAHQQEVTLAKKKSERIAALSREGWKDIERYAESELADSYELGAFPVELSVASRQGDLLMFNIRLVNRGKRWIKISVYLNAPISRRDDHLGSDSIADQVVLPGEEYKGQLSIYLPAKHPVQEIDVEAFVRAGEDFTIAKRTFVGFAK